MSTSSLTGWKPPSSCAEHTLPTRPFYSAPYLPVRAFKDGPETMWSIGWCRRVAGNASVPPSTAPGTRLGLRCCCCTAQLHLLSFANGRLFKPSAETRAAQGAQRAQAPSQENWTKLGQARPVSAQCTVGASRAHSPRFGPLLHCDTYFFTTWTTHNHNLMPDFFTKHSKSHAHLILQLID